MVGGPRGITSNTRIHPMKEQSESHEDLDLIGYTTQLQEYWKREKGYTAEWLIYDYT